MRRCWPPCCLPSASCRHTPLPYFFIFLLLFLLLGSETCSGLFQLSHFRLLRTGARCWRPQRQELRWKICCCDLKDPPRQRIVSLHHRLAPSGRQSSSNPSGLAATSSNAADNNEDNNNINKLRLNKVFKATHSRRQADALIASGRVTVNDQPVPTEGCLVEPWNDVVCLDGRQVIGWEALNGIAPHVSLVDPTKSQTNRRQEQHAKEAFEYIKYWKPVGVTCTTDRRIEGNILDALEQDSNYRPPSRVYPVGRLDKDTSGLILLTNDGRLPGRLLRNKYKQPKVYNVLVDKALRPEDIKHLRSGVVITTVAQRDRKVKPLTAKTKPCQVRQVNERGVQMVLMEGRNRQIRKMMAALGYRVVKLHRVAMGDISLRGMNGSGSWERLCGSDLEFVQNVLESLEEETFEQT